MAQACFEDREKRFFVLGVIHRDDEGPDLLRDWLVRTLPDVITLEFSNYGLEFRKRKGDEYRRKIKDVLDRMNSNGEPHDVNALSSLFSFIDLPYEYEVASRYAGEHNASLYLIDMDAFSYLKLRKAEELFEETNIRQIFSGEGPRAGGNEKAAARLFFEKGIKLSSYDNEMYVRDKYMSNRISVLMKHHTNKRFLHVCGWQHLEDPYGLYVPLNPMKVFLHDKTLCI
jgi:hypothetical protein